MAAGTEEGHGPAGRARLRADGRLRATRSEGEAAGRGSPSSCWCRRGAGGWRPRRAAGSRASIESCTPLLGARHTAPASASVRISVPPAPAAAAVAAAVAAAASAHKAPPPRSAAPPPNPRSLIGHRPRCLPGNAVLSPGAGSEGGRGSSAAERRGARESGADARPQAMRQRDRKGWCGGAARSGLRG